MYESAAGVKGVFRWLSPKGMDANEYAAGGPDYPFKLRRVPRASSAWAGPWTLIELLLPGGGFRRVAQLPAASGALYYAEDMLVSAKCCNENCLNRGVHPN
jgi:hypothetical protein